MGRFLEKQGCLGQETLVDKQQWKQGAPIGLRMQRPAYFYEESSISFGVLTLPYYLLRG
jgi:hypothetical protein